MSIVDGDRQRRALERALRDLEMQSAALETASERLGGKLPELVIDFPQVASRRRAPVLTEPAPRARWTKRALSPPDNIAPLVPYPGHACAAMALKGHPRIGYLIETSEDHRVETLVRSIHAAQRSTRSFVPVFITTSTHFAPLLRHGYAFEYLTSADDFDGGGVAYATWRERRLDFIRAKWALDDIIPLAADLRVTRADDRPPLVITFPAYGEGNPYVRLMYAGLGAAFEQRFGDIAQAVALARDRRVIFHLHWQDAVFRNLREDEAPGVMAEFVAAIDRLRRAGGKFLWTVHNLEPHDVMDHDLSAAFTLELLRRIDRVHVHDEWAAARVRDIAGIDVPVIVVPHPSYAGAYPNAPARDEARERLGLGPDEDVFLSFGNVRRYKGVDNLLNVAAASGPDVRFVIAGKATRFDPRLAAPSNCTILDGHIDDATVADLHAAADFAVLPLEEVTTSGSLMLALSFGLPVIAPRHSAIVDLVSEGREGSLYDPSLPGGLEDAIGRARQTPPWRRAAMRAAAAAAAAFHPPDAFATAIRHMLDELVQPSVAVADAAPVRKRRRTASARPRAPKVAATQGRSKRPWGRAAPRGDR